MKYATHGMDHGHFDRLGFSFYDQGMEALPDYGAVRFINVEPKFGGRYLPENATWAKQTVAHNTLVVDGRSHFEGNISAAGEFSGERRFFDVRDPACQVMSGIERSAYPGVALERTMALVRDSALSYPFVIDVLKVETRQEHTYDLPFYFQGQFVSASVPLRSFMEDQRPWGSDQGYQHLWLEAEGPAAVTTSWTWLLGGRYYSVSSATDSTMSVQVVQTGASDPNFNLRHQEGVVLRRRAASCVFVSIIEPHGVFDPVSEVSRDPAPIISSLRIVSSTDEATVLELTGGSSFRRYFKLAHGPDAPARQHEVRSGENAFVWVGNFSFAPEP
jgi:oligo-alginate lyase